MATEVKASHILVKTPEQIETLKERLAQGETFEDLAKNVHSVLQVKKAEIWATLAEAKWLKNLKMHVLIRMSTR